MQTKWIWNTNNNNKDEIEKEEEVKKDKDEIIHCAMHCHVLEYEWFKANAV